MDTTALTMAHVPAWPYSADYLVALQRQLAPHLAPCRVGRFTVHANGVSVNHVAAHQQVNRHIHPYYEGFVVLEGCIDVQTPWQTHQLSAGHLALFSPGSSHYWRTHDLSCRLLVLSFELDTAIMTPQHVAWPISQEAVWDTMMLFTEVKRATPGWPDRARGYLTVLYSRLLNTIAAEKEQPPVCEAGLVARVDALLRDHLSQQLSLQQIADHFSFSERHLTRRYKQATGTTIAARHLAFRLDHAATLLRTTHLSIRDIAAAVGIADAAYFARRFQQRFNVLPRIYRRYAWQKSEE